MIVLVCVGIVWKDNFVVESKNILGNMVAIHIFKCQWWYELFFSSHLMWWLGIGFENEAYNFRQLWLAIMFLVTGRLYEGHIVKNI